MPPRIRGAIPRRADYLALARTFGFMRLNRSSRSRDARRCDPWAVGFRGHNSDRPTVGLEHGLAAFSGCAERGGVGICAARAGGIWQPASPARHTAAVIAKVEILIASSPVVAIGAASLPARNGEPEVPAVMVSLHDRSHGTAPPALR